MPKNVSATIRKKLHNLAEDPYARNNNVKQLKGYEHAYRLRVGDYRVLYEIHDNVLVIRVIDIAPRGGVYK